MRCLLGLSLAVGFCAAPRARAGTAPATAPAHAISAQGGWWNIELEYRAPFGLFVAAGLPWFAGVLDSTVGGMHWDGAAEGKLGYQYSLTGRWKVRAGFRAAFSFSSGCPCGDGVEHTTTKSFGLVEAGVRYEHPWGLVIGIEVPLYVFDDLHELVGGDASSVEHFPPGPAFLFSQVYCGYSWR